MFDAAKKGNVTLIIDDEETYTETKNVNKGSNFFYVQVDNTEDNDMLNAGTGTMKTQPLDKGSHTYTITDKSGTVLMAGTFTI